jgi:hypothetical protein
MTTPTHVRRFVAAADAAPDAYRDYVRQRLGVEPHQAEALLGLHRHLHHGGRVEDQHVRMLQTVYGNAAAEIPGIVAQLNAQPPGSRPHYFLALLSGDREALGDNLAGAGSDYRELDRLSTTFHEEAVSSEINARRDKAVAHEDRQSGRSGDIERWPDDGALSTRSIISRMLEPAGIRAAAEAVERGEEGAVAATRHLLADRLQAAQEKLHPDADVSLRESVAAAFESDRIADAGRDQGWLSDDD